MNENFTPLISNEKTLKDLVESISQKSLKTNNSELSNRIGTVKGLLSAYELAPSEALMSKIALELAKIIDDLLINKTQTIATKKTTVTKNEDIYDLFSKYLQDIGLSQMATKIYVRNVKRVFKNEDVNINKDLYNKIDRIKTILSSLDFDITNQDALCEICDLLISIIEIKSNDIDEIEKNKKDHGSTLCALKRFYEFIKELIKQLIKNKNV